jgi:hypothetical protein
MKDPTAGRVRIENERVVHLAGDVPLQAADDLLFRLAFLGPSFHIGDRPGVVDHSSLHNAPQGRVGLAVTAAV